MNAIVAADENWGIGRDNDLLCHLPGDLKYFKEKTLGRCVIFGRRTLESLPGGRPLPGRDHIILTGDASYAPRLREGHACHVVHSRDEVMNLVREYEADKGPDGVFVCGGESIYRMFLEDCRCLYVTRIHRTFDADRFFPDPVKMVFEKTWESPLQTDEDTGIEYTFQKYERA